MFSSRPRFFVHHQIDLSQRDEKKLFVVYDNSRITPFVSRLWFPWERTHISIRYCLPGIPHWICLWTRSLFHLWVYLQNSGLIHCQGTCWVWLIYCLRVFLCLKYDYQVVKAYTKLLSHDRIFLRKRLWQQTKWLTIFCRSMLKHMSTTWSWNTGAPRGLEKFNVVKNAIAWVILH